MTSAWRVAVGCGVGHLLRSVVVDRRSPDHGVNAVTVVERRLQRLEHHHGDAAAEDRAVGPDVERPAVAQRRHHRTRFVPVPDLMRDAKRHAAGQGHVAFAGQQALARQVNRDQRRRAGGLHRQAGSAQVELVRHPRGQVVLVVLQRQVDHLEGGALRR